VQATRDKLLEDLQQALAAAQTVSVVGGRACQQPQRAPVNPTRLLSSLRRATVWPCCRAYLLLFQVLCCTVLSVGWLHWQDATSQPLVASHHPLESYVATLNHTHPSHPWILVLGVW
jgi:hypothetical protein